MYYATDDLIGTTTALAALICDRDFRILSSRWAAVDASITAQAYTGTFGPPFEVQFEG